MEYLEVPLKLLRQCLKYDPLTGNIYHKRRPESMFNGPNQTKRWNGRFAGKRADSQSSDGYIRISINRARLRGHRVAWALYYGEWPQSEIDHINGDRCDNRIQNLRLATRQANMRNISKRADNTSGATGVGWHAKTGKWRAHIRKEYIGLFNSFNEALAAREQKAREYGFTKRHGK